MRTILRILGVAVGLAGSLTAQTDRGYPDDDQLARALREAVAGHERRARLSSLGEATPGQPIWTVELGSASGVPREQRPGLLVVSNLGGDRPIGDEVLVGMVKSILDRAESDETVAHLLDEHVLYFIPRPNPEATRSYFTAPRVERRLTGRPTDQDRDGRVDEDGPDDLNGDGLITQMRVPDPDGEWLIDPEDSRRLKKADPKKGERGTHHLWIEGRDDDADGQYNEDPPGGVDLARNFAHAWQEHDRSVGPYPNSEAVSRALIDWVLAHRNIAMIWVLDRHDNLVEVPKGSGSSSSRAESSGEGSPGRRGGFRRSSVPATQIQSDDLGFFEEASEKFRELLGVEKAEAADADGAFHAWAYFQFGVPGLASQVWYGPDGEPASEDESEGEAGGEFETPQPSERRRGRKPTEKAGDDREAEWLDWNERVLSGRGFVPWTQFEHPQLGTIEIGGWKPFARTNPPVDRIGELVMQHTDFLMYLGQQFARVRLSEITVESHGSGLFTLTAVVTNEGHLPTAVRQGEVNREVLPVLLELELHGQTLVLGDARRSLGSLAGQGARRELTWTLRGEPGSRLSLEVRSQKAGRDRREIRLTD